MDVRLFLHLVRALIPRWNFFDTVGHHFTIEARASENSSWERIDFSRDHRLSQLFFNPSVNASWLKTGLVEQFATDVQGLAAGRDGVDAGEVEALPTFSLIRALVTSHLGKKNGFMQFKIVASSEESESRVDVFVSDWLKAAST